MSTVLGLQLGRARTMIRADEYCIRPSAWYCIRARTMIRADEYCIRPSAW